MKQLRGNIFIRGAKVTTDGTQTTVITIPTANDSVTFVEAIVVAIKNDGAKVLITKAMNGFKNDGGVLTKMKTFDTRAFHTSSDSAYDFVWAATGTNILGKITGKIGETLNWGFLYYSVPQFV